MARTTEQIQEELAEKTVAINSEIDVTKGPIVEAFHRPFADLLADREAETRKHGFFPRLFSFSSSSFFPR